MKELVSVCVRPVWLVLFFDVTSYRLRFGPIQLVLNIGSFSFRSQEYLNLKFWAHIVMMTLMSSYVFLTFPIHSMALK